MSYRRDAQHDGWSRWLREHRAELIACGLPPEVYKSEMDWLVFLDHGYVQSPELHESAWWSIKVLGAEQASRLRCLLVGEYRDCYADLIRRLELVVASDAG